MGEPMTDRSFKGAPSFKDFRRGYESIEMLTCRDPAFDVDYVDPDDYASSSAI